MTNVDYEEVDKNLNRLKREAEQNDNWALIHYVTEFQNEFDEIKQPQMRNMTEFRNQKYYAQGDIQPEYGKAFLQIGSNTNARTFPSKSSRGGIGKGESECCNVCTDEYFPPSRDINEVSDITFLEVKARIEHDMGSKNTL